ncbi:hypothetical protein N9B82_04740 [Saprospiraceae bacterium]|nr:hypothetical protein [Saprospiraceae bacterium]
MMTKKQHVDSKAGAEDNLWRMYLNLLYVICLCIFLLSTYLLLKPYIHSMFDRKVYTQEELMIFNEEALVRERARMAEKNWDKVEDGIHLRTGLHSDENLQMIITTCTSCHSAKLITQNRATREGWKSMISWMQETQGLGNLGKKEPIVLDYLAKYYAPKETGRRKTLDVSEIEWYELIKE